MSRPSMEQVSSLNSTRSRNSNDSKSSANELLSITDAAVSALSKTSNPRVKTYVRNNEPYSMFQNGISLLSPTDSPPQPIEGRSNQCQTSSSDQNVTGQLSDGSRSTTASEILIKSTMNDKDILSCHNSSNLSDVSKCTTTSEASSAFITGQAQRVKIPSKKLKEIKSPFENREVEKTNAVSKHVGHRSSAGKHDKQDAISARSNKTVPTSAVTTRSRQNNRTDGLQSNPNSDLDKLKNVSYRNLNASDDPNSNKETLISTDSGYLTQNIKVIREKWPIQENVDEEETPRDIPSMTEEIGAELHSNSPIDVTAKDKERQSSNYGYMFLVYYHFRDSLGL